MCMFCAAMPMVVAATAVAQGEQRKKLKEASSQKPVESHRKMRMISPMRISQIGAAAFAGLLIASAFYHTHMPG